MGPLEPIGRTRVMGIVNVTPDSFSDGGRFASADAAIAHGRRLLDEGADILDIGGESTRPGATRPLVEEELARVLPVIETLAADGAVVSVDTMRAVVAERAVAAGARLVNDVSGGLADPLMLSTVAATEAAYVAMHWRAHSDHMNDFAVYDGPGGVVAAVRDELASRVEAADSAGLPRERLVLDPGLGFAKQAAHNWELLHDLAALESLGLPLLVGASRKRFLGELLADSDGPRPIDGREAGSTALTTVLALRGTWAVRVHDARASRDAVEVVARCSGGARVAR